MRPVWLIVVVLGWGCGGDDPAPKGDPSSPTSETPILPTQVTTTDGTTTDSVDTGTEPPDPAIATAEALFQPDHVVMVDIDMDPADAERLGSETNRIFDLLDNRTELFCREDADGSTHLRGQAEMFEDGRMQVKPFSTQYVCMYKQLPKLKR